MAELFSNYLKVILYPEDIFEMHGVIRRDECFTVQHFNYESKRRRIGNTFTRDTEDATILDLCVRINTPVSGKLFLEQMKDVEKHAFSFLFNATFNAMNAVETYEDAMVVCGYIVDVDEEFATVGQTGQAEQMLMNVKLLINTVTFIGKQNNMVLSI